MVEGPSFETGREPPLEVRDELLRDRAELQREVILWQRWLRYLALPVMIGGALMLAPDPRRVDVLSLLSVAVVYVAAVFVTAWAVQRWPSQAPRTWLPALLLTTDLVMVGAIVVITRIPLAGPRFLVMALLSVALAAFYFGSPLATFAMLLSAGIYLLIARLTPTLLSATRPVNDLAEISLFALVGGLLTYALGSFRARMNTLRLYCKLLEEGDLTSGIELAAARFPDDVTLLARSFEAMRSGLAGQIGTDTLTGCLNRRALEKRLKSDWRLAKRRGTHLALAAIDLDHFKQINDTRGHPVGDIVLQQLAGIMKSTARDTDAVARFGGDEFVILLPDTGWQGALTFAERLRRRVDDFTFGPPGSPMTVTISVGVALARGTDPILPEDLLKEADRSLYRAKQQGRNRVFA
ncbi:MAG TPA: GGDEF domain-containing protein [Gemmatimonadaceae bacterium]|nr:GGDEF domain-containing protein [Gemmatimonadaceae bacterium]